MVRVERMRLRINDCQPCEISSLKYIGLLPTRQFWPRINTDLYGYGYNHARNRFYPCVSVTRPWPKRFSPPITECEYRRTRCGFSATALRREPCLECAGACHLRGPAPSSRSANRRRSIPELVEISASNASPPASPHVHFLSPRRISTDHAARPRR